MMAIYCYKTKLKTPSQSIKYEDVRPPPNLKDEDPQGGCLGSLFYKLGGGLIQGLAKFSFLFLIYILFI